MKTFHVELHGPAYYKYGVEAKDAEAAMELAEIYHRQRYTPIMTHLIRVDQIHVEEKGE